VNRAVLALGANLGEPASALHGAVDALRQSAGIEVIACSSIYETEPVGGPDQPRYLNAVVLVRTSLDPSALLAEGHRIELQWGRVREVRWGARTLDIDVIAYEDIRWQDEVLTLPHPRAHERAFVLVPWIEVEPDAVLPGRGAIRDLIEGLDVGGVRATGKGFSLE
jgi:2-amino-4-hydroxy-6-hydroxymethyldihydropteridine diphosphokinase